MNGHAGLLRKGGQEAALAIGPFVAGFGIDADRAEDFLALAQRDGEQRNEILLLRGPVEAKARFHAHVQHGHRVALDDFLVERVALQPVRAFGKVIEAEPIAGGQHQFGSLAVEQADGAGFRVGDVHRGFGDGAEHFRRPQGGVDQAGNFEEAGHVGAPLFEVGEEPRGGEADEQEEEAADDNVNRGLVLARDGVLKEQPGQHGGAEGRDEGSQVAQVIGGDDDGEVIKMHVASAGPATEVSDPGDQGKQHADGHAYVQVGRVIPQSFHKR